MLYVQHHIYIKHYWNMCVWMKLDLKLLFLLKTCNRIGTMVLERVAESYCLLKLSNTMNMTVCFVYFSKQAAVILWSNIFDIFDNNCLANVNTVLLTVNQHLFASLNFSRDSQKPLNITHHEPILASLVIFKIISRPWSQVKFAAKQ